MKSQLHKLRGQLFSSTQIPVCLGFLAKNIHDGKRRDRSKHTIFIDARGLRNGAERIGRTPNNRPTSQPSTRFSLGSLHNGGSLTQAGVSK
jgi:hypothetical protein